MRNLYFNLRIALSRPHWQACRRLRAPSNKKKGGGEWEIIVAWINYIHRNPRVNHLYFIQESAINQSRGKIETEEIWTSSPNNLFMSLNSWRKLESSHRLYATRCWSQGSSIVGSNWQTFTSGVTCIQYCLLLRDTYKRCDKYSMLSSYERHLLVLWYTSSIVFSWINPPS